MPTLFSFIFEHRVWGFLFATSCRAGKPRRNTDIRHKLAWEKQEKKRESLLKLGGIARQEDYKKKTKKINDLKKGNLNYPMIENRQKVKAKQLS